jgi:hypothetical protein
MKFRRLLLIVFAAAGWVCAGVLGLLLHVQIDHPYDDSISLSARHTEELLALHARSDQGSEVLAWMRQYHGEAPGHQVMVSFAGWAVENVTSAEKLIDQLQSEPGFVRRLSFALADSCLSEAFGKAFAQSDLQAVKAVINEVTRPASQGAC